MLQLGLNSFQPRSSDVQAKPVPDSQTSFSLVLAGCRLGFKLGARSQAAADVVEQFR